MKNGIVENRSGRLNFPPLNLGRNGGGEKIQPSAETNTTDLIVPGEPAPVSWRDSQLFWFLWYRGEGV